MQGSRLSLSHPAALSPTVQTNQQSLSQTLVRPSLPSAELAAAPTQPAHMLAARVTVNSFLGAMPSLRHKYTHTGVHKQHLQHCMHTSTPTRPVCCPFCCAAAADGAANCRGDCGCSAGCIGWPSSAVGYRWLHCMLQAQTHQGRQGVVLNLQAQHTASLQGRWWAPLLAPLEQGPPGSTSQQVPFCRQLQTASSAATLPGARQGQQPPGWAHAPGTCGLPPASAAARRVPPGSRRQLQCSRQRLC